MNLTTTIHHPYNIACNKGINCEKDVEMIICMVRAGANPALQNTELGKRCEYGRNDGSAEGLVNAFLSNSKSDIHSDRYKYTFKTQQFFQRHQEKLLKGVRESKPITTTKVAKPRKRKRTGEILDA